MDFRDAVQTYAEEPLTRQLIMDLLKDYKRPYDKISELVKKGELTQVKRGIYVAGPRLKLPRPESLLVANHLHGPSYVSVETVLAHWGLIPERVYEIGSATVASSRSFKTPLGRFTYQHMPLPYYAFGIRSVQLSSRQVALIASPEKALCDKIVMTAGVLLRSTTQVREFLLDDLRMDEEGLRQFDVKQIHSWVVDAPKQSSLNMLIKTLSAL